MAKKPDLEKLEKIVRKIELNILKITREKPDWDKAQEILDENYKLAKKEKLLSKLNKLYQLIPKKYTEGFKKKVKRGIIKISSDFFITVPKLIYEKQSMYVFKRMFEDLAGQIVFCFSARSLILYAKQKWVWPKDFQRLVNRYNKYTFRENEPVPMILPWGRNSAKRLGFDLFIDWRRLSKGWRDYLLSREKLRYVDYSKLDTDKKDEISRLLIKIPSFGNIRGSRMVGLVNLEKEPEEWLWSCQCEDYIVNFYRNKLVLCHHVAAAIWKLMDDGMIKKPWE